jgi:hypothetical protein
LFVAVCEAFSNAYSEKEEPNKTRERRLVKTFPEKEVSLSSGRWWTPVVNVLSSSEQKETRTRLVCLVLM